MEILLQFLVSLFIAAALLWLVSKLGLGMTVTGFGAAFSAALVLAALGVVFWLVSSTWEFVTPGDASLLVTWMGFAFSLWLAAKFVPGVKISGILAAFVLAFVLALMVVVVNAIVGGFNL